MRPTTVAMAVALGIGLPCFVVQSSGFPGWAAVGALAGIGFAVGIVLMVALDETFYRADQASQIRQRNAHTDGTRLANWERQNRLESSVASVETVETTPDNYTGADWYRAIETFIMAGDVRGFSIRKMQGVVGSDVWAMLTTLLAENGWLVNVPGRGYQWADNYNLTRAILELRADRLPYPAGPAPLVIPPVHDTTSRRTTRQSTAVIVDN